MSGATAHIEPLPNDKAIDGGPLAHKSKQDANPPFAAPLGWPL